MEMAHSFESLFAVPGYFAVRLHSGDISALQVLLEKSSDYSQLVTGAPPGPAEATSLLISRPEGKALEDKFIFGIYTDRRDLIGVLDFVRGYPEPHDWWVGLLLFDPDHRGRGSGRQVMQAFEQWAREQHARRVYLGVVEHNQRAYRFWRAAGFEPVGRKIWGGSGDARHELIVMSRPVEPEGAGREPDEAA